MQHQPESAGNLLSLALDKLSRAELDHTKTVGTASAAVTARVLGMTVETAHVSIRREEKEAGYCSLPCEAYNPQHLAVLASAVGQGAARALPEEAHPLAAAAVEEIFGQQNYRSISDLQQRGHAFWRRQADADAGALLAEPAVWERICVVAAALKEAGRGGLDQLQVEALVPDPAALTDYQVWTPETTGLAR